MIAWDVVIASMYERARCGEHREVAAPEVVVRAEQDAHDEWSEQERADDRNDAEPGNRREQLAEAGTEVVEPTGADEQRELG